MTSLIRRITLMATTLVAVGALAPSPSQAQIPIPFPTPTPTPKPSASSSPTPSPKPSSSTQPKPTPKPTPKPSSKPAPRPAPRTEPAHPPAGSTVDHDGSGATVGRPRLPGAVADDLLAWETRAKSPARTTTRLLDLIEQLHGSEPPAADVRSAFGSFPVAGYVWYQDDYGAPRFRFAYRFHEGTDLFAVKGTPVIAVTDGVIWKLSTGGGGGTAIWLLGDDGVRYYYGHLNDWVKGIAVGRRVSRGQLIGHVGDSGNAKGTYPHVHFEVNPGGRGTVNPKPILDGWLSAAERAAQAELTGVTLTGDGPTSAVRWDLLTQALADTPSAPPALWTAGLDASGATLAYADLILGDLLPVVDWGAVAAAAAITDGEASDEAHAHAAPWDPLSVLVIDDPAH